MREGKEVKSGEEGKGRDKREKGREGEAKRKEL